MRLRTVAKQKSKINKSRSKLKKKFSDRNASELIRSPISGTYILPYLRSSKKTTFSTSEVGLNSLAATFVNDTPQVREQLSRIPNLIGAFECKLCRVVFKDAIELAIHNCPRVVHLEYRCEECGKVFNCPANLASHKRWHKPATKQFKTDNYSKSFNNNKQHNWLQQFYHLVATPPFLEHK